MDIAAKGLDFQALNRQVKAASGDVCIRDCCGQRFIGSGLKDKTVTIHGTPGNALGAYLDGAVIEVHGNVQDAVGDTMNAGEIVVHGNAGDALGYAMRGGAIYVRGDAGYRAGIHMKAYEDKQPVIVIAAGWAASSGNTWREAPSSCWGSAPPTRLLATSRGPGCTGGGFSSAPRSRCLRCPPR